MYDGITEGFQICPTRVISSSLHIFLFSLFLVRLPPRPSLPAQPPFSHLSPPLSFLECTARSPRQTTDWRRLLPLLLPSFTASLLLVQVAMHEQPAQLGLSVALDASGPVDMTMDPPSFTLSQSGTFVKEDFAINKQGITAVNGNEVARLGLHLADLEMLEVLGKGASSLVRKARHRPSQTDLAVKIVNVFDKSKRDQLLRELRTLYTCAFPWLVAFHDCLYDDGAMYIVLEYMDGGSLADVLRAAQMTGSRPLSELVIAKIAARVLASLNYLHRERHQVHRDMKPGNILLNSRGAIKISDFGLSAELDSTKEMCATFVGTHAYMSPERLGGKPYSFASDIWSLGITLVECALGEYPYTAYTGSNYFVLLSQILNDPPPQLPVASFSPEFRDFIAQCLCKEPEGRPSAHQLLSHPFIRMYDDSIRPFDMADFVSRLTDMRRLLPSKP